MKYTISFVCFTFLIGYSSAFLRPRIVGGEDVKIKNFPYQASLRLRDRHFCGGVIVTARHILTAAHCITKYVTPPYQYMTVCTGTSSSRTTVYSQPIANIAVHPGWIGTGKSNFVNDIAVITLPNEIRFNEKQQKIKRLATRDVVSGTKANVTGWGNTTPKNGKTAFKLQKLEMTVLTDKDCQSRASFKISKKQMCAYHSVGHGSCFGDSGSPLVVGNELVGIVSWVNEGNCANGEPEVYTNVYAYRDFIDSEIKK